MKHLFILTLLTAVMTGCVTTTEKYYWGSYEHLLYDMYNKPGSADPGLQIDQLTQDIQRSQDAGKLVPPGVHAHLGFMYALVGNAEQSHAAFLQEKNLFPESAVLIDGMIERATKGSQP